MWTTLAAELVICGVAILTGAWLMRTHALAHQVMNLNVNVPNEVKDVIDKLPANQKPVFNFQIQVGTRRPAVPGELTYVYESLLRARRNRHDGPARPVRTAEQPETHGHGRGLSYGACGHLPRRDLALWRWIDLPLILWFLVAAGRTAFAKSTPMPLIPPSRINGFLPSLTRADGILTMGCYVGLVLLVPLLTSQEIGWLLRTVVVIGAGISVLAIAQARGKTKWALAGGVPDGTVFQGRAWGTLANPIFLGGFLTLCFPLSLVLREWWALLPCA